MIVTFFQKQIFLGCWKDLRVWVKILLLKWKSKNRTSSKKNVAKGTLFSCGSQKRFCAGRTKLFWSLFKIFFALTAVKCTKRSCSQPILAHLTGFNVLHYAEKDKENSHKIFFASFSSKMHKIVLCGPHKTFFARSNKFFWVKSLTYFSNFSHYLSSDAVIIKIRVLDQFKQISKKLFRKSLEKSFAVTKKFHQANSHIHILQTCVRAITLSFALLWV